MFKPWMAVTLALFLLGPPVVFSWIAHADRWRTVSAASRARTDGERALESGDAVRALVAFQRARELRPDDPELQRAVWRARAVLVAEVPDRLTGENIEEVRYEVERLVEAGPEASALTALAHILRRSGDIKGADARLDEALKLDPKSVVALLARAAESQRTATNADAPIAAYQEVVKVSPDNFAAHLALGRLYGLKRDAAKEVEELQKATSLRDDFGAWQSLGDAYLGGRKLQEAFDAYKRAAALNPQSPDPHWRLGTVFLNAGQWADAEKELRVAGQAGRYPDMAYAMGLALARQDRCSDAAPLFLQFVRENPQHGPGLQELGVCAAAIGQKDAALAAFKQILAVPLPAEGDPRRAGEEQRQRDAQAAIAQLTAPAPAAKPAAKR